MRAHISLIAALLLATGTAHAEPDICKHFKVVATLGHSFHLTPIEDDEVAWRKLRTLEVRYNFKINRMYLNGKRCPVDNGP